MKSLLNKKSIIITVLVIIAVALAIFLTAKLSNIENKNDNIVSMEKIDETNLTDSQNIINNKNIIEENVVDNTIENNINNTNKNTDSSSVVSDEITDTEDYKEKAIRLVKEDWGEDDSVYFDIAEIEENGIYKVCVRDKNTTNEVMWYEVDVVNNTVKML